MGESVGVQAGRVCPRCGREDSISLIYGMPGPADFRQAERGVVALGGCLMPQEVAAFVCRSCDLQWGSESDPTADEAALAELLGVAFTDLVRALGAGWRRESGTDGADGVDWFVSGEPAQVSIGVQGPWFVLGRPFVSGEDPRLAAGRRSPVHPGRRPPPAGRRVRCRRGHRLPPAPLLPLVPRVSPRSGTRVVRRGFPFMPAVRIGVRAPGRMTPSTPAPQQSAALTARPLPRPTVRA